MTAVTKELKTDILWKMSEETEREMERRKLRWSWHWSSFYTDKYCMTHSLATGRVGAWVCTRLRVLSGLGQLFMHPLCIYVHVRLTWFVSQHIQFALWCLFLIISSVSRELLRAPLSAEIGLAAIFFIFSLRWEMQALWVLKNKTKINGCVWL